MLCKNTAYSLIVIAPKLNKNENSQHLLEFQYILQNDTLAPWLFNINSNVQFHPTVEEETDSEVTKLLEVPISNVRSTISNYKDTHLT